MGTDNQPSCDKREGRTPESGKPPGAGLGLAIFLAIMFWGGLITALILF